MSGNRCRKTFHKIETTMRDKHIGTGIEVAEADYIAALRKGFAVLECFDTERQRLNATVAAERTGITRAAARRHLLTLSSLGYLETDGSFFWLTPKVLRFSGSYLASARLPRVIQPTLNRLAVLMGEALSGAVLDGEEAVIIGRSGPTRPSRIRTASGGAPPCTCHIDGTGATSKSSAKGVRGLGGWPSTTSTNAAHHRR